MNKTNIYNFLSWFAFLLKNYINDYNKMKLLIIKERYTNSGRRFEARAGGLKLWQEV